MKYPILYIQGKGRYIARFTEMTRGQLRVVKNVETAIHTSSTLNAQHLFLLYEQQDEAIDCRNIRLLHSGLPQAAIILITATKLNENERRNYLAAGVNSALNSQVSEEQFLRTTQFISDYTFTHRPVLQDRQVHLFRMPLWKRLFDIAASSFAILLLSPLLLGVALAVKIDSPGPVIYRSKRVGSNYRVFDFLKFRSMRANADKQIKELNNLNQYVAEPETKSEAKIELSEAEIEQLLSGGDNGMLFSDDFAIHESDHQQIVDQEQENAFVKFENDPRITRLGRFIRKYSIDELPQLFNILLGDMSVVGNRPLPLYEAENLTSDEYIERFICPAGLTGLWQVEKRGGAGKLSPEQRKQLDIEYAQKMSFWLDMKIILRTFTAFIQKENV